MSEHVGRVVGDPIPEEAIDHDLANEIHVYASKGRVELVAGFMSLTPTTARELKEILELAASEAELMEHE